MGTDAGSVVDAGPPCDYPEFSGQLGLGETIPNWRWTGVRADDGSVVDFDMEEFFCSPEYADFNSIVLVISAGWCPACPEYIRNTDARSAQILDNGGLILYLEVETADFQPADSASAETFIYGLIADGPGLRMGDADNTVPSAVRPLVTRMPSGYFIRRRDMQITADQEESIYTLDWPGLTADPDQTWVPTPPPFVANCGPADEEPSEPNDALENASTIADGEEVMGGVCAEGSDWYRVDLSTPWRFDLYSDVFVGDLNLRLYTIEGERIGGSSQRSMHDWVDYDAPAYVEVYGFESASGTYRVTLGPQP
ncbi:MAG: hypothetical protein AB7S26_40825 [Sandaracinaceae bacterium]